MNRHSNLTSEQNQLTLSVEDESEHIPSCRRQDFPLQTEIALQPVDVASLQIEQSNDIPISRPNDQLQLHPSTDSLKVEPAMPFKLPPSTVGLSSECNQLDTCAITQSESEPRSEWCSSFLQTEVLTRQPMAETTSQVEQCVHPVSESSMQLLMPSAADIPFRGLHMEDPQETRLLLESMQTSLMISHRLPLPSLDPLNNELAKLHSKKEEGFKMHEDVKLRLATECDKEIEEVRRKYNKFIHDSEVLLMEKKQQLELMMDKIHLNKMLAEVVKPGFPHAKLGWQPSKSGMFSTLTQQFPMQSLQQNAQRPPRPPARPVQVVHHPSELFSSKAPVPHSSPIIPQHANHRINSDSRVLPLHHPLGLTSTSAPGDSLIRGISCQISPTRAASMQPLPSQFWPRIPHTMEASNGNQLRVHSSSLPSIHNSFPSAPELLTNLRNWSGTDRLQF